ncbi:hypothetical protein C0992_000724 [Termitomyces sp. T32_za158]|nr:hypothetical protein C0992_000724 [Termitomyces sp. T32_za158]
MARRLYLGRLPTDARSEDVNKFFEGYGRIIDCRVMTGAFDAEDAVHQLNGKPFMGASKAVLVANLTMTEAMGRIGCRVEIAADNFLFGTCRAPRSRRPPGIRLLVTGVSRDTSWQVRTPPSLAAVPFGTYRTLFEWPSRG